jgi:hypothetical protein
MMKTISLAGIAALLAARETVPVVRSRKSLRWSRCPLRRCMPKRRPCPPMNVEVAAEAKRLTLLDKADTGAVDLTAALMVSEIHKNERLREAARAYEVCRQARN